MGKAPILPETDGERKTKISSEERIREGDLSKQILLEEPRREPGGRGLYTGTQRERDI